MAPNTHPLKGSLKRRHKKIQAVSLTRAAEFEQLFANSTIMHRAMAAKWRALIKVKSKNSKVKRIQGVGFWSLVFSLIQKLKTKDLKTKSF